MKKQIYIKFLIVAMAIAVVFTLAFKIDAQTTLPTPDFSEFEKKYEIVKWDYNGNSGKITMVIKAKTAPPHPREFRFKYFDEDGIDPFRNESEVYEPRIRVDWESPVGQTERVEIDAPDESKLKKITQVIVYRVLDDGTLIGPKPEESKSNSPSTNQTGDQKPEQKKTENNSGDMETNADCSFEKYPQPSASAKFSDTVVKGVIYQSYAFETETGGLTSPLAVGVNFLSIKYGTPFTNTVTNVPGRGATRRNDAAPVGAKIYPFHTTYIVCKKYRDSIQRTQWESGYNCFINKDGGWACGVDGGAPKITYLK